jgi:hypothetical protein
VIPLSDGVPARRFPIVHVAIIVANFVVGLDGIRLYPHHLVRQLDHLRVEGYPYRPR